MKPTLIHWAAISPAARNQALQRPSLQRRKLSASVADIIDAVRANGDKALLALTQTYDQCDLADLEVDQARIGKAQASCSRLTMAALQDAKQRIHDFHQAGFPSASKIETVPGMRCESRYQAIDTVGLYVPGGTAPLVSTVLMLGIPAQIAGCKNVVLCTPPRPDGKISTELLAAISLCKVDRVFTVGGAQAIAAMAFGTETIPRCNKLFGPGNAWVTEAKQQVSMNTEGAAIDLPAGPSEVMVIADNQADAESVAWDLLSQAEHGPDSQVILLTDNADFAQTTARFVAELALNLPRAEVLRKSLEAARIIVTECIEQAVELANQYAPEHLIVNTRDAREVAENVRNAGSVFIGAWTPESLGDYCSGTNHVLPTYGWARSHGALSAADFMRRYTIQEASPGALQRLGPTAETLATVEGLDAHRMAIRHRLNGIGDR